MPDPVPAAIPADAGPIPAGLLPVTAQGRTAFLVARRAVTHREYAARVPRHRFTEAEADLPVTGISWWAARNFASAQGCRLLTEAEWLLARDTPGFAPAGMRLWEWLATDQEGDDRPVRGVAGSARRPPRGNDDVTFRLAADPR